MTPETKMKLKFDSPIGCLVVIIGGKYLNRVGDVMEKVNFVTNDVGGVRPMAVFLISNKFKEHVLITFTLPHCHCDKKIGIQQKSRHLKLIQP